MVDVVDRVTRSRMMSGIRSKNTRPEWFLRQRLHAKGFRYRLHAKNIPGKPDLVFPKYRALVVVNGCFWHGHSCRYFKWPASNPHFWREKISSNRARDIATLAKQIRQGWRVLTVWECAIRQSIREQNDLVVESVAKWLQSGETSAVMDEKGVHENELV